MKETEGGMPNESADRKMFVCIWEYRVRPAERTRFETTYGPEGPWVELFRRARGHVETRLCRDRDDHARYVTVDPWEAVDAYDGFRRDFAAEYTRLDAECEPLTHSEVLLGHFEVL